MLLALVQAIKLSGAAKLEEILIITDSFQATQALTKKAATNYLVYRAHDENGGQSRQTNHDVRHPDSPSFCFLWRLTVAPQPH